MPYMQGAGLLRPSIGHLGRVASSSSASGVMHAARGTGRSGFKKISTNLANLSLKRQVAICGSSRGRCHVSEMESTESKMSSSEHACQSGTVESVESPMGTGATCTALDATGRGWPDCHRLQTRTVVPSVLMHSTAVII